MRSLESLSSRSNLLPSLGVLRQEGQACRQREGSAERGSPVREEAGPGGTGRAPRHHNASSSSGTRGPAVPLGARPGLEMGVPMQLHL